MYLDINEDFFLGSYDYYFVILFLNVYWIRDQLFYRFIRKKNLCIGLIRKMDEINYVFFFDYLKYKFLVEDKVGREYIEKKIVRQNLGYGKLKL